MKKFKANNMLFPMPVLLIATYNQDNSVNVMNAAWGTMEDMDVILIELTHDHKTSLNIKEKKAFTVAFADKDNVVPADYVGIVSGNKEEKKFEKTGWTTIQSEAVDAPIINELPVTLECELVRIDETNGDFAIYGKIKSVSVRDDVLNEKNQLDLEKCQFITYNSGDNSYRLVSTKVADAFRVGLKLR